LAEAIYFGDEIVLMNDGRVVQKGSVADLREKPATLSYWNSSTRTRLIG